MGRVRNRATTVGVETEPVPKVTQLLFPKPQSFVVEGKGDPEPAHVEQVETRRPNVRTLHMGDGVTNVRLRSLRNVVNNKYLPQFVKYAMTTQPTQREIGNYLDLVEVSGFGRGAIVARRWGITSNWKQPPMWGMIMVVNRSHTTPNLPYAPFIVKWIHSNETEPAWAEDLYIINQALDDRLIQEMIEAQGGPWDGTSEGYDG